MKATKPASLLVLQPKKGCQLIQAKCEQTKGPNTCAQDSLVIHLLQYQFEGQSSVFDCNTTPRKLRG